MKGPKSAPHPDELHSDASLSDAHRHGTVETPTISFENPSKLIVRLALMSTKTFGWDFEGGIFSKDCIVVEFPYCTDSSKPDSASEFFDNVYQFIN